MIDHGITSFKLYMTYPAMIVNDCDMYKILKKLGKCGCFAGVHCENAGVIDALIAEAKKEGRLGPENHPLVRPDTMEAEAVHRLLVIAKEADAPVMVVHLTNKKHLKKLCVQERTDRKYMQKHVHSICYLMIVCMRNQIFRELFMSVHLRFAKKKIRTVCGKRCHEKISRQ